MGYSWNDEARGKYKFELLGVEFEKIVYYSGLNDAFFKTVLKSGIKEKIDWKLFSKMFELYKTKNSLPKDFKLKNLIEKK